MLSAALRSVLPGGHAAGQLVDVHGLGLLG